MHGRWREGGETDRDIFGALRQRCAIPNPFSRRGHDRLTCGNLEDAAFMLDAHKPTENHRDFGKLWTLTRLLPVAGGDHTRDAQRGVLRRNAADEFFDPLWFVASGGDDGRLRNKTRHATEVLMVLRKRPCGPLNTRATLQANQIRALGAAERNSENPLSASAFVSWRFGARSLPRFGGFAIRPRASWPQPTTSV
jgi:hypothetical protein